MHAASRVAQVPRRFRRTTGSKTVAAVLPVLAEVVQNLAGSDWQPHYARNWQRMLPPTCTNIL